MYSRFSLGIALVLAMVATAAHAQHGGPVRPHRPAEPAQRHGWVAVVIEAINEGTGVEAWQKKDAMRLRLEIDFDPPKVEIEDEETSGEAVKELQQEGAPLVHGVARFDLRKRIMRFDDDDGLSFLVDNEGVSIWRREAGDEPMTRDDVRDEALDLARALRYLLIMPLWINDEEAVIIPGGLRHLEQEPYYTGAYILRNREAREEVEEEDADAPPRAQYPDDWYAFFTMTYVPHRIDAIAYLAHDRSRPLTEFPMPRLIFFDDFEEIDEVAISRSWRIHAYSRARGLGEQIGRARVPVVEFVERGDDAFDAPEDALRVR